MNVHCNNCDTYLGALTMISVADTVLYAYCEPCEKEFENIEVDEEFTNIMKQAYG